jgi:RNA-binding protein
MITAKERSRLRGLANTTEASLSVGKGGLGENLIKQAEQLLYNRELVKGCVLQACEFSAEEVLRALCEKLGADPVQHIGRRFVLYKYSPKDGITHVL